MSHCGSNKVVLDNAGKPTGWDSAPLVDFDSARVVDKLATYTGREFDQFDLLTVVKSGRRVVIFDIGSVDFPLVFEKPGTYSVDKKTQKTAFGRGTLFFRHGAKSAPAKADDLVRAVMRIVARYQKTWLRGVTKVVQAKPGDTVRVVSPPATGSEPVLLGQISLDGTGVPVRPTEADSQWPYRQKDVVRLVSAELKGSTKVSPLRCACSQEAI